MTRTPSPKADWLRKTREDNHYALVRSKSKQCAKPVTLAPVEEKIAVAKKAVANVKPSLANGLANASTTYKSRDPEARRNYQRELMRKRRAEKTT